jgi:hypothetical protein
VNPVARKGFAHLSDVGTFKIAATQGIALPAGAEERVKRS